MYSFYFVLFVLSRLIEQFRKTKILFLPLICRWWWWREGRYAAWQRLSMIADHWLWAINDPQTLDPLLSWFRCLHLDPHRQISIWSLCLLFLILLTRFPLASSISLLVFKRVIFVIYRFNLFNVSTRMIFFGAVSLIVLAGGVAAWLVSWTHFSAL